MNSSTGTIAGDTAIHRPKPSRPLRDFLQWHGRDPGAPALDYGCGRGADVEQLNREGWDAIGYDPHHDRFADSLVLQTGLFDLIISIYVINVIKDPDEQEEYWRALASLVRPGGLVFVAARTPLEIANSLKIRVADAGRGVTTSRGTYQQGYGAADLSFFGRNYGLGTDVKYIGTRSTYSGVVFQK